MTFNRTHFAWCQGAGPAVCFACCCRSLCRVCPCMPGFSLHLSPCAAMHSNETCISTACIARQSYGTSPPGSPTDAGPRQQSPYQQPATLRPLPLDQKPTHSGSSSQLWRSRRIRLVEAASRWWCWLSLCYPLIQMSLLTCIRMH